MGFRRSAARCRVWASFGVVSVLAVVLALAGATGGSAQTGVTSLTNDDCPPTEGRVFCVVLTTYDNAQRIGGLRVDLQLQNYDQNTLTNPFILLEWTPNASVDWIDPKPSSCSPLSDEDTGDQLISCGFANLPGVGSGGGFVPSPLVTLYFSGHVPEGVDLDWTVTAFLNESGNDPPTVPNTSVRTVTATQGFSSGDSNDATTFAVPESTVQLGTLQLGQSTLRFPVLTEPGDTPFPAAFSADDDTTGFCFGGLTCLSLVLTSTIEGPTGLKIWNFLLENATINPNSLRIIHRYDPLQITAIAGSKFQTSVSYVGSDGVRLENLTGLGSLEAKDYFVVKATETTFQISNKRGGKPIPFPAGGTADAERIRIVGDQRTERAASCSDADLSVNVPSMSATRVGSDIEACLADFDNGRIGPGG